jgi:hypothetical protein
MIDLEPLTYGTHSLRRTKVALIYKKTPTSEPANCYSGHRKLESTVRDLGIEVDDALELSESSSFDPDVGFPSTAAIHL